VYSSAAAWLVSVVQPPSQETARPEASVTGWCLLTTHPANPDEVAQLVDDGKLKALCVGPFPLREIQQAHALIEARHTQGKIVLQVA